MLQTVCDNVECEKPIPGGEPMIETTEVDADNNWTLNQYHPECAPEWARATAMERRARRV